jgi:hypothetical protein
MVFAASQNRMPIFPKSLKQLRKEAADLSAELDGKWDALFQDGPVSSEVIKGAFRAEHIRLVELRDQILHKTSRKEIFARRDELKKIVASDPTFHTGRSAQWAELSALEIHIICYHQPIKARQVAAIFGIAVLILVLIVLMVALGHIKH